MAIENIVSKHQGAWGVTDEVFANDKGLSQAIWARLQGVFEVEPPVTAVTQQLLETRGVLRGRNDEDVANAGQHQSAERIVDHRLVVNG